MKKSFRRIIYLDLFLSFLTGLLFFLMLNLKWYFLVWVCLVPAFYMFGRDKKYGTSNYGYVLYAVLIAFLIASGAFYWLLKYKVSFYVFFVFIVVIFGFILGIVHIFLARKFENAYSRILFVPVTWAVLMFIFSFFNYGNMWMKFAYFQPMMFPLGYVLQPFLFTVFIILFNALIANYFITKNDKILGVILICLILILGSFFYSYNTFANSGRELNVLLVQGQVTHGWTYRQQIADEVLTKYEGLTREHLGEEIDLIIWPEYAIPADFEINDSLNQRVSRLAREMNSSIILGSYSYVDKSKNGFDDLKYDRALFYSSSGELVDYYDAQRVMSFSGDIISGTREVDVIDLDDFDFNMGLCFEEYIDRGSITGSSGDFVVVITNNHHFDYSVGLDLVAQFSRLKALEKNKYVIRSSNTGYTQVINPYGKIIARIEPYRSGTLSAKIYI